MKKEYLGFNELIKSIENNNKEVLTLDNALRNLKRSVSIDDVNNAYKDVVDLGHSFMPKDIKHCSNAFILKQSGKFIAYGVMQNNA